MTLIVAPAHNANGYVSVVDAQSYATVRGLAFTGDNADLEGAIIRASVALDGRYGAMYPGTKAGGRSQTLLWPRDDAYDMNGDLIEGVPFEVVNATTEMAVRELANPGSLSPDVVEAQQKVLTKVEGLEWDVISASTGAEAQRPSLTVVDDILASLIGKSSTKVLLRS